MLSIGAMSGGQGEYYIGLGREDYYTAGGEPPGLWMGKGAKALGLSGMVEPETFRQLLTGHSPAGTKLIQNAGSSTHQPGWDLTFSAPKSVSVIWSQADAETRHAIQAAQRAAVKKALSFLEATESYTRRGSGGLERERVKLIAATFEHGTSRAQDPQLHTHALVINVGVRADGTTGTILSKPLYQAKMAAGAIYRAELAQQLEKRLHLAAERHGRTFEIRGVSRRLMEEFSKRREEIVAALDKAGFVGAKAAAAATLLTREVKGHIAREELFIQWHVTGMEQGFSLPEVKTLTESKAQKRDLEREKQEAVHLAIEKITDGQSYFTARELIRHTAEEAQGRGLGAKDVATAVSAALGATSEIVRLGKWRGEEVYTTREMLETERRLLGAVETSKRESFPLCEDTLVPSTLSPEQKRALHHITETDGAVKVVSGMAGTGKTTLVKTAREIWEASGFRVIGSALSGKAAQGLEEGAGIKSETLHATLAALEKGTLQLDGKTIVVVDEAGMVGTRQMERLVSATQRAGAKLVLVGDDKQLQPIEAGGPFKAITERLGAAELTDIRRQRDERDREAVKEIAGGRSENALRSYAERGLLTVEDDRRGAIERLITDWRCEVGKKPEEALIITGTRLEAATINKRVQEERHSAKELGQRNIRIEGTMFFENDRILFTKNSRMYGVKNGSLGTIERIDELRNTITAKLDSGERTTVSLTNYQNLALGYAITTHKGQGVTVEKSFVLSGGEMLDRELSYVQASRARGETRIYTDRNDAGDLITALAKQMNKSRQKEMAEEVRRQQIEQPLQQERGIGREL